MDPQITPDMEQAPQDVPVQMPAPKTKSNTPLIIILAILALAGLGFGVYGMFFMPPKTVEKVVEKTDENDAAVREVIDKITEIMSDEYNYLSFNKTYADSGYSPVIYKNDNLKVATNIEKRYSMQINGSVPANTNLNKTVVDFLQENKFEQYTYSKTVGNSGPEYLNKETGVICSLSGSAPENADITCSHTSWLSKEKIALINQLADAAGDDYPMIHASVADIVDSSKTPYQRLIAGSDFGVITFYRVSPDSEWKLFTDHTELAIECKQFDTDDLKKAFFGEPCEDDNGQESTVSL